MNKPIQHKDLIPVRDFAKGYISRRGFSVTPQYIYKLISDHKATGKVLSFQFTEIGKAIWINK